jgi:hypothetical protein
MITCIYGFYKVDLIEIQNQTVTMMSGKVGDCFGDILEKWYTIPNRYEDQLQEMKFITRLLSLIIIHYIFEKW